MIKRATHDDAYTLARFRQAMWDEMNPERPSGPEFRETTYVYWYETLEAERAVAWLALADGQPVGMAALLIHHHPPRPYGTIRRGYVTAVYVVPEARRNGHGHALMQAVIAHGRELGLQRLELRTSDTGRPLYERAGFQPAEFLILRLDES
jgi:GNAT superfamily N-acetyltransferase